MTERYNSSVGNIGSCTGPNCQHHGRRCYSGNCPYCCRQLHGAWRGHERPDGSRVTHDEAVAFCKQHGLELNGFSVLPAVYGGVSNHAPEPPKPVDPVLGTLAPAEGTLPIEKAYGWSKSVDWKVLEEW